MKKLVLAILILSGTSFSQILDFLPDGLGLELGIGHSQMKHQVTYVENYTGPTSLSRDKFNLTPSVRLSYEKELINSFSVMPFISYSINGGKSNKREDGYEDEYILKTLDLGIFASCNLNVVTFSIGGKYNRFLDRKVKIFSYPDANIETRSWYERDVSNFITKGSFELGGRTAYSLYNFTIAMEAWFSMTELGRGIYYDQVDISSNRFQFMVGYRL